MSANKRKFEQRKLYYLHYTSQRGSSGLLIQWKATLQYTKDLQRLVKEGYLIRKRDNNKFRYGAPSARCFTRLFLTQKGKHYITTHKFSKTSIPDLSSRLSALTMGTYGNYPGSSWCIVMV